MTYAVCAVESANSSFRPAALVQIIAATCKRQYNVRGVPALDRGAYTLHVDLSLSHPFLAFPSEPARRSRRTHSNTADSECETHPPHARARWDALRLEECVASGINRRMRRSTGACKWSQEKEGKRSTKINLLIAHTAWGITHLADRLWLPCGRVIKRVPAPRKQFRCVFPAKRSVPHK